MRFLYWRGCNLLRNCAFLRCFTNKFSLLQICRLKRMIYCNWIWLHLSSLIFSTVKRNAWDCINQNRKQFIPNDLREAYICFIINVSWPLIEISYNSAAKNLYFYLTWILNGILIVNDKWNWYTVVGKNGFHLLAILPNKIHNRDEKSIHHVWSRYSLNYEKRLSLTVCEICITKTFVHLILCLIWICSTWNRCIKSEDMEI